MTTETFADALKACEDFIASLPADYDTSSGLSKDLILKLAKQIVLWTVRDGGVDSSQVIVHRYPTRFNQEILEKTLTSLTHGVDPATAPAIPTMAHAKARGFPVGVLARREPVVSRGAKERRERIQSKVILDGLDGLNDVDRNQPREAGAVVWGVLADDVDLPGVENMTHRIMRLCPEMILVDADCNLIKPTYVEFSTLRDLGRTAAAIVAYSDRRRYEEAEQNNANMLRFTAHVALYQHFAPAKEFEIWIRRAERAMEDTDMPLTDEGLEQCIFHPTVRGEGLLSRMRLLGRELRNLGYGLGLGDGHGGAGALGTIE